MTTSGANTYGIDLGGTNVRCAVVDEAGRVVADVRDATPDGWERVVGTMAALVRTLAAEHAVHAVGVGAAGLCDRDGVVRYAPNIPGLVNAPLRDALAAELQCPVIVDNDANVAARAELVHGAARGVRYALVVTLGTGIGGGIIARGRVIRGAYGFAAEIGHFQIDGSPDAPLCACGERGHWEAYASGTALGRRGHQWATSGRAPAVLARVNGDPAAITGIVVGDAAQAGDPDALAIVHEYASLVAIGLAGLSNILDPERIVISGGLVELGETLFEPLRAAFTARIEGARYRPEIAIVAAELGEQAGVIGAATLARDLLP
jgi:glucokinase